MLHYVFISFNNNMIQAIDKSSLEVYPTIVNIHPLILAWTWCVPTSQKDNNLKKKEINNCNDNRSSINTNMNIKNT